MTAFDLIDRPWILVHRRDGVVREVSIRELFAHAADFRSILGDVPTQGFALLRLLLAILHRSVEGPRDTAQWLTLWRDRSLPTRDIDAYLDHFRDRFDLLSPEKPFYQVADLRTEKSQVFGLERLIADVPSGAPYFTTRLQSGIERISFAEAARWVVHCQAFDPSGIKSGAVGDRRVKGGKGYPIGTGWAGAIGGVMVEGNNLRETLLLHLIPEDFQVLAWSEDDLPVWERDPQGPGEEADERRPYGPLDLYTWQSRRLRLFHDGSQVTGAMIANGDRLAPQNRHRHEPMTAWRRSQAQERKLGTVPVYMPREHEPERAVWRGLNGLLPNITVAQGGKDAPQFEAPAVLKWLSQAQGKGIIGGQYHLHTRAVGMKYGSQQATTSDIIDDAVTMPIVLLAADHPELGITAVDAVNDAEAAAQALGQLAGNLAVAAGGEPTGPRDRMREVTYSELDRPFRSWLASITPETDPAAARADWQRQAYDCVMRLGVELVAQAGPVAWRGRQRDKRHFSSPEADLRFRRQLRQTLPLAQQKEKAEV